MPKVKSLTYVCKLQHPNIALNFCPFVKCYKNIFTSVKLAISFKGQKITIINLRPCFNAEFGCLMTSDYFGSSNLIMLLLYRINSRFKKHLLFSNMKIWSVPTPSTPVFIYPRKNFLCFDSSKANSIWYIQAEHRRNTGSKLEGRIPTHIFDPHGL